jgi:hypothetical protein
MSMAHHEVPTVFVRGFADPHDVRYVEEQLTATLAHASAVRYSVLWIETVAIPIVVEIEVGAGDVAIGARADGPTVRAAGDACLVQFSRRFPPVLVEPAP